MDASAISLARENKIPIIVFDIHKSGAFAETLCGQGTFTIIKDEG
jgi:uridylate kinase